MAAVELTFQVRALVALGLVTGGGYMVGKCVQCFSTEVLDQFKDKSSSFGQLAIKLSELKISETTTSGTSDSKPQRQKSELSKKIAQSIVSSINGAGDFLKSMSSDTVASVG